MDAEKILEVIGIYRNFFDELCVGEQDFPNEEIVRLRGDIWAHCYSMIYNMESLLGNFEDGKEKRVALSSIQDYINLYRGYFIKNNITRADFSYLGVPDSDQEVLAHCHSMLYKMEGFIKENRIDKTLRWLGFIQGCLWSRARYTLSLLDIEGIAGAGLTYKLFIYLGFIQGCLWSTRCYTIDDLRNHSRPDDPALGAMRL